jgi:hypothetical protein
MDLFITTNTYYKYIVHMLHFKIFSKYLFLMHILYKIYLDFENKHSFIIELISPQQPIYGILYF